MTLATDTFGPVLLALTISLSRPHWKRKLFTNVGVTTESQLATKKRVCVTAVPFAVTELLFTVVFELYAFGA